jgi:ribosome-binding protein aMBF1 (putative translation factor)
VKLDLLPSQIRQASLQQRNHFQIDEDGDQVYWPDLDVHMGWSQFRQAVDPASRIRAQQKDARFNKSYGAAIRDLRESHGLNQSDIRDLDERTVRRIEQGETRATANAIEKLAAAHRMKTNDYMQELANRLH